MIPEDPHRVALHEAGHAVAALALNLPVCDIRIGLPAPTFGQCRLGDKYSYAGLLWDLSHDHLMFDLAGRAAEAELLDGGFDMPENDSGDGACARRHLAALGLRLEVAIQRTLDLIRQRRDEVLQVAKALETWSTLTGDEARGVAATLATCEARGPGKVVFPLARKR